MKTTLIVALFGAFALTACGDKKAPETTNPDSAQPAETTPPAETPAEGGEGGGDDAEE